MKRDLYKYICMLLFLLAGSARLAWSNPSDTIRIREVEISHSIPLNNSTLISTKMDTISMEMMSGRNLSELLSFQPSIFIKSSGRGSLSTASFRGTDASHTKVFWNGIRMNSPMLGQVDFSQLPVCIVDDLSLLYGGSSMIESSGALGGAVLMENAADWNQSTFISLNQEFGSFGTFGTYGKLAIGDDKVRSVTRIYRNRSENNYTYLNTEILPHEKQNLVGGAYVKGGLMQEIYMRPGKRHELSLHLWYQDSERELPAMMSQEGADRDEKQEDRNLRTSVEWKMYPGFGTIKLRSGYAGSEMQYYLQHNDLGYRQFHSESRENSLYNTLQTDINLGSRSRFQIRADYNRHEAGIEDFVQAEGYQHLRNEASLLATLHHKTGQRWIFFALIRQEWADGDWLPIMPSAGFRYSILKQESFYLRGSISRNYNLPSLNDLYWIPGGNPDLRPENSINSDLSLNYTRTGERIALQGKINGFAARVVDWILWEPTRFRYWVPQNLATVFSRGMDIQLGSDLFLGNWLMNFKASYAYTRSTSEGDTRQLIYIPVHSSNAYLNISSRGYYLNYTANFTGSRNTQPGSVEHEFAGELDPYTLQDLHIGKSWQLGKISGKGMSNAKAGLRFTVYNLFNVSYQAIRSRPMPMRNYALTIHLEI